MDLIFFLGRLHVLVLHLPIGILLLAAVMEGLARTRRFAAVSGALPTIWLAGAVTAVVAIALGYFHAAEGGFSGPVLEWHRWSATATAVFAFAVWALRVEAPAVFRRAWPVASVGVALLLVLTGHFGGQMTHGETFLVEYAPAPIRRLAGDSGSSRPPVTEFAQADLYLDVVAPALRERCAGCHNSAKRRGGLSLASYEDVMAGGDSGPVLVAGDPAARDLLRRNRLPADHVDAMPKDGKTPLNAPQIESVRWWIAIGAPAQGTLGELPTVPADVEDALRGVLGLGPAASAGLQPPEPGNGGG
jgi:uncharacterized membrane protein